MAKGKKQKIIRIKSPTDGALLFLDADTLEVEAYPAKGGGLAGTVQATKGSDKDGAGPAPGVEGSGREEPGDTPADADATSEDEDGEEDPWSLW